MVEIPRAVLCGWVSTIIPSKIIPYNLRLSEIYTKNDNKVHPWPLVWNKYKSNSNQHWMPM